MREDVYFQISFPVGQNSELQKSTSALCFTDEEIESQRGRDLPRPLRAAGRVGTKIQVFGFSPLPFLHATLLPSLSRDLPASPGPHHAGAGANFTAAAELTRHVRSPARFCHTWYMATPVVRELGASREDGISTPGWFLLPQPRDALLCPCLSGLISSRRRGLRGYSQRRRCKGAQP